MPQNNFSAQVSDWVAKTKDRIVAVRNESVQELISVMQIPVAQGGNMPIDTGFLRASLEVHYDGQLPPLRPNPFPSRPKEERGIPLIDWNEGNTTLSINNAKIYNTITVAYGAEYAIVQEAHRQFVALAAQQWPQIVEAMCAKREAMSR